MLQERTRRLGRGWLGALLGIAGLAPAQELLPGERAALAAVAAGRFGDATDRLLALAQETAAAPGDANAAARVEAWVVRAAGELHANAVPVPLAAFAALLDSPLARQHPLLRDRLGVVRLALAERLPDAGVAEWADQLGVIPGYRLCGPFDNERGAGFRTPHPLEQRFDLDAEFPGKRRPATWRELPPLPRRRWLPLATIVHPHEQTLVFAAVAVLAEAPQTVVLELGTTGSFKVFCNGAEVGAREAERELRFDQDAMALPLQAGANLLLLKLCHQEGDEFGAVARLRGLDGSPLTGVRTSAAAADLRTAATTQPRPAGPTTVPLGGRSQWPLATTTGADLLRANWLWADRAADGDLERRDLAFALAAAKALPTEPEAQLRVFHARTPFRRSAADRDDNERRRALEAALALAPDHATALVYLGFLLQDSSGLWRAARELADHALAKAPSDAARWLRQATLRAADLARLADRELVAATTAADASAHTLAAACAVIARDSPARALAHAERLRALRHDVDDSLLRFRLLCRTGSVAAAVTELTAAVAADPYALPLRQALAEYHLAVGAPQAALALYEAWLAIAPDDAGTMVAASHCWRRLVGTVDGAAANQLALLRSALEVEPTRRDEERYAEFLAAAANGEGAPFYAPYRLDGAALVKADAGPPADAAEHRDPLHWLLRQRIVRANGNGTTSEYTHQIVRVLTEDGARRLAVYRLRHWSGEQRARLLSCTVHRADGTVVRPNLRGAAAAMPNLRPGDIVDVEGRIDDVAPTFFGDYFGLVHRFTAEDGSPVRRSELQVLAEPGRSYRQQSANGAPAPTTATLPDGTLSWHWALAELPRDVTELRRPDAKERDPLVRMTTYRDWDHFAGWWWNLIKNQQEVTPAMRQTVAALTKDLPDTEAKIAAVYRFVTTDVRYEAWEFGVHGYKPYSTAVIHERRHGDCKDKALLLCALLGELGVPCQPVLIFADPLRANDDLELPMVQQFNHAIAWLPPHEGRPGRFLDGTATWHPPGTLPEMDQGAHVLVVDQGRAELRQVPWTTPADNRTAVTYEVQLRADGGAELTVEERPLGNAATELRSLLATEPARRREQLERRLVQLLGNVTLQDVTASDGLDLAAPVVVRTTATTTQLGQRSGDRWQLPSGWRFGDLQQLANEPQRTTPLLLGVPTGELETVRFRLPGGWVPSELPPPAKADGPFGSFAMAWRRDGDQVVVERRLEFTTPRIEPADYPAFREFVATVKAADGRLVLLQQESRR